MEFKTLVQYFEKLEQISSRLEIRSVLLELLGKLNNVTDEEIYIANYFLTGKIVPDFIPVEFGIQEKTIKGLIISSFGISEHEFNEVFSKTGDLGDTWVYFASVDKQFMDTNFVNMQVDNNHAQKVPSKSINLAKLYFELLEIALISGKGSTNLKNARLKSLLFNLSPVEGKYIIRFILGKLRLGLNVKSILEALAYYGDENNAKQLKAKLEYFYGVTNDIGYVVYFVLRKGINQLDKVACMPGVPIASQLAEREKNLQNVFKRILNPRLEPKYDGLRGQVHIFNQDVATMHNLKKRVWYKAYLTVLKSEHSYTLGLLPENKHDYMIFSRNASNLSYMFPEIQEDVNVFLEFLANKQNQKDILEFLNSFVRNLQQNKQKYHLYFVDDLKHLDSVDMQYKFAKTAVLYNEQEFIDLLTKQVQNMQQLNLQQALIFDSEIVGYDENTQEFIPFQQTMTRRRKYDIKTASQAVPIRFFVFDVMFLGFDTIQIPFVVRRALLEFIFNKLKNKIKHFILTPQHYIEHNDIKTLTTLFEMYVSEGLEGVMLKCPFSAYKPGDRSYSWIKFKRAMKGELADTVDVVVLGYYKGKGKRSNLGIGALLVGIYDKNKNEFLSISKLGTGITDKQWVKIKELLDQYKVTKQPVLVNVVKDLRPDVWVDPKVVMVVEADEITKSPIHTAKYALRFPRFKQLRTDKDSTDITTLQEIEQMYILSKVKKDE